MYLRFPSLINDTGASGTGYDSDAQAYFTGASITDTSEKNHYNTFVLGCKTDGVYSKLKTFHPLLGSSLTTKSYNAINTSLSQTSTGGFNISTGVSYNGALDSFTISGLSATNCGMGFYIQETQNLGGSDDFRNIMESGSGLYIGQGRDSGGNYYMAYNSSGGEINIYTNSDYEVYSLQFTVESATNYFRGYDGTTSNTSTLTNSLTMTNMYIGDSYGYGQNIEIGCHYTSEGLTIAETTLLVNRIITLMSGLGR